MVHPQGVGRGCLEEVLAPFGGMGHSPQQHTHSLSNHERLHARILALRQAQGERFIFAALFILTGAKKLIQPE